MKFPIQFKSTPLEEIVGESIAAVLPDYGKPWFRVKHLLLLNLMMLVPLLSSATSGYDGSLMNGLQSMQEWRDEFGNPKGAMLGLVNAAQPIGGVIILPASGYLSDTFGRKKTLTLGLIGVIVATIIQATSHSLGQLIASRFIVGIFGFLALQPSPMLIAELSYPSYRGKVTCLYFTFYYIGAILASWSCYGCTGRGDSWAWRIPTILQGAFPVIQTACLIFVPESPRWLMSKNRVNEARSILVKHHAGGDEKDPLIDVELLEISNALDMEKEVHSTGWGSLLATPGNRKRTYIAVTLGIFAQWSGTTVISYYFTLVLDTIGITSPSMQTLINACLQIFNFVFASLAAMSVDFFGRRFLFLWSAIGMLISYVIWTICSAIFDRTRSVAFGRTVLGFIFIFFFHYDIAYTPLLMGYPTEIFPFSLRSKGVTIVLIMTNVSLTISSFCNSIAMDNIGWRYYIVFCVILALIVLNNYFFYPETKGYSLEEIAVLFDGEKPLDLENPMETLGSEESHHDELEPLASKAKKAHTEHLETVTGSSSSSSRR